MGCNATKAARKPSEDKTAAERKVAWEKICQRLPRQKTPEDKELRIELFKRFCQSDTEKLTMEEVYQGCVSILQLDEFTTRLRSIVKRAFTKAKSMGNTAGVGQCDDEFVEFLEFRLMLCYIYDYLELTVMFEEIDTSGNMLVDAREFKAAVPKMGEWGLVIEDPDTIFKEIDDNGSGQVPFDELAAWATARKLDADEQANNSE
ncbi:putative flagellar calcium-binding protein [Leishmania infantum JPCM5]|uniref:EF-hand_domain_containing_protein_-_putative n=2 Tax=Leishmania infantum TaxID=5671 RepID=A0A6L0X467_LEIIN|nr:putative flagellar calcium-binding protein [Leishmania infantum JPCM5]CAC9475486.1 EF-hand_domain_containing_protein_-_putative [Leishmania infantum]CAM66974.1 putative flagellar calcium-binding protein [Leishmania infantum JPCM5]SUZ40675.1 EF-hand_domain_containing_protein_-_putative [Leishmania infantum]|eukprot:XP_001464578.1 putative flagellar calcium-binding protein [Leishmania infantum JPCM5]